MRFSPRLLFSTLVALSVTPALAQTSDTGWLDQVTEQIAEAEQCEVGFFIHVREQELGGRRIYEARVQCVDGRQFDATRADPDTRFSFALCQVKVC